MAKKKKSQLESGYYDARTSTNVTDSSIQKSDSGWKIVKNQTSNTVNPPIVKTHAQTYNLDGTKKIPITVGITNNNIINTGEKNKLNEAVQNNISQKILGVQNNNQIDLSGKSYLKDTGKTYGDYYYDNYAENKDKKIYLNTKDRNYYLNNNGKYEKLGTGTTSNTNTMTTVALEDKKIEDAKKLGYKGSKSSQELSKYISDVSKKTGYSEQELYDIANDYANGKWDSTKTKYENISVKLESAGYQAYDVANKINKLKEKSTQKVSDILTDELFPQEETPWYKKVIKGSEVFKDGYDPGDITKTAVATVGDIGANVTEGFLNTTEGLSDTLQYGVADILDVTNHKKAAQSVRNNAKFNSTAAIMGKNERKEDNFVKGWSEKLDKNSISGEFLDTVAQGVGNIGALAGSAYLSGGGSTATFLNSFASAYGNAKSTAYQNGADDKTATETALVSGLSEAISEQIFDGIPGMKTQGWGEKLVGRVGSATERYFGTKTGRFVMKLLDNSGEGFEEIISNILNVTGNNIVHSLDKNYNYGMENQTGNWLKDIVNSATSNESLEAFISASITSALVNSGNTFLSNKQKNEILKTYAEENGMSLEQAKSILSQEINLRSDEIKTSNLKERVNTENEAQNQVLNEMQKNVYKADERVVVPKNDEIVKTKQNSSEKLTKQEIQAIAEEVNNQKDKKLTQTVEMPKENQKTAKEYKRDINTIAETKRNEHNSYGASDALIIEMSNKTKNNFDNKKDVKFVPINDILPYSKPGGYRTDEQINELTNEIRQNGIKSAIEINYDDAGNLKVVNGNHRLDIANKLGLEEVPVRITKGYSNFIESLEKQDNIVYNEREEGVKEYARGRDSEKIQDNETSKAISGHNDRSGAISQNNTNNIILDKNRTTGARNVEIYSNSQEVHNGSSSNSTFSKNDTKGHINSPFFSSDRTNSKTDIPIAEEFKKKVIKDKVKAKKNNNGLKSARTAAKIAQNKMELSNNEKNEFRKELMKYKGYTKEKLTNARTYNEIKDIVKKYSDREISYLNNEIKDVKDYIKNTQLKVTQELKDSITDYNDFRKSNFGKLKLSNDGVSVDSFYEELSQTYPGYFSNEILTDEDRLYAIADFMNEDTTITEKYSLDDKTIDDITAKVFNTLQENAFSKEQIEQFEKEISDRMSKITRKSVREMLQKQMGITAEDLSIGKDIKSPNYQITDPIRVNEKVFGRELGDKINNETIRKTTHNEARKIRWLNSERNDIKELGIKPRSKESAAVQKYGEKKYLNKNGEMVLYGDKELMSEFPNTKTQEKIKRAAEVIRNKYDRYIDEINQTLTSLGYDAIPKRTDYMRHFQELGDIFSKTGIPFNLNDMRAEDLPTDINGLTEFNRPGKNYFASAQKRIGEKTTYDAITGIDGYLEGAGNLIYHTADIQRYRALSSLIRDSFGSKGFDNLGDLTEEQAEQRVNDILDNKLSRYAAWLDEQANNLAGKKGALDRFVERWGGRRVYTGLNAIKKQVGSNMTGFNVRSALTNLISSTIASAKTNKLAFVKGTASTIRNMFKNDSFIDKSDFLTTRFGSDQLSKKLWQKASNAGQIFMTGTDYFTANQITRSKYYEGLQKGMSESEAIKYADDFASRVMGDRSLGRTAEAFNSKTLGLLTQFQLETNNQWQYMIHDTIMDYQKNSEINGGLKAGATVLFQMGQLTAFSYFFNEVFEALTGSRAAFDPIDILKKLFGADDDDKDKSFEKRLQSANAELLESIPFTSLFGSGGRLPISEVFVPFETSYDYLTGKKNKYGGDVTIGDVGSDWLSTVGYLLPTGYSQAKKTVKGLSMFSKDKEIKGSYTKSGRLRFPVKDTAKNRVQAGLFGEYSSDEARKYFDEKRSALTENQQRMYNTLKIPISDYWKINKEISKIKQELKGTDTPTEERKEKYFDYIDSLDISDIKKSILKKSLYKSYYYDDYEIEEYINSSNMSKKSKKELLEKLGLDK